jgi:hypothetical protein
LVAFAHIGVAQRLTGLVAFFLPVVLPFLVEGAVDGIGITVDALSDAASGAAGAAAFFLFIFVLAAPGGMASMRGRAGFTMITLILLPTVSAM